MINLALYFKTLFLKNQYKNNIIIILMGFNCIIVYFSELCIFLKK